MCFFWGGVYVLVLGMDAPEIMVFQLDARGLLAVSMRCRSRARCTVHWSRGGRLMVPSSSRGVTLGNGAG